MANGTSQNRSRWVVGSGWGLALLLVVTCLGTGIGQSDTQPEPWSEVALIYHSDVHGKIEPCG